MSTPHNVRKPSEGHSGIPELKVDEDKLEIKDADGLWARIGRDGVKKVASEAGLAEPDQLKDLLVTQCQREAAGKSGSKPRRLYSLLERYALEVILAAGVVVFGFLMFWATHGEIAVIVAHDLPSKHMLRPGDVEEGLAQGRHYFRVDPDNPKYLDKFDGWILARDVSAGEPLRYEHVLRSQVVAAKDIPSDMVIDSDHVVVSWSPYERDAETKTKEIIGDRTRNAIRSGEVVLGKFLADRHSNSPPPR